MQANTNPWTFEKSSNGVFVLNVKDWRAGAKFSALLISDPHTESSASDLVLLKRHLDEAKDLNAPVLMNGDLHDLMNCRNDKRRSASHLRPEIEGDHYLDKVEDFVYKFYKPYRDIITLVGKGNHDTGVEKYGDTDMCAKLVKNLGLEDGGTKALLGDYQNWVAFRFFFHDGKWATKKMLAHHGFGGASPVTKGVIDTARVGVWAPDADISWMGHSHQAYILPIARTRMTNQLRMYSDHCLHLRTPGYKNEHHKNAGWAIEKGMAPTTRGGIWLKFSCKPGQAESCDVNVEASLAL